MNFGYNPIIVFVPFSVKQLFSLIRMSITSQIFMNKFIAVVVLVLVVAISSSRASEPIEQILGTNANARIGQAKSLIPAGNTLTGWTTLQGTLPPNEFWTVEDGTIRLAGRGGGDIITDREYENFILDFQWTIRRGGNSGIKYRVKRHSPGGWLGPEYQILDDFNNNAGKKPKDSTATLFDVMPTNDQKVLHPHDQINTGRIVVHGNQIQHWLNGKKVLEIIVGSDEWEKLIADSKFRDHKEFGKNPSGFVLLQEHGAATIFHQLIIREIILGDSDE